MFDHYIANINPLLDNILYQPDMLGFLIAGCHLIPIKKQGANIILEMNIIVYSKIMGFDKSNGSITFVA